MAEQYNSKMAGHNNNNNSCTDIPSVDLDNLFSFLSDVQSTKSNHIIDEIGEKMDELVENLDVELESVIQQELQEKAKRESKNTKSPMIEEAEKNLVSVQKKIPSLPEPKEPPPPPPPPPPPQFANGAVNGDAKERSNEPIYESVLPRDENGPTSPVLVNGSSGHNGHANGDLSDDNSAKIPIPNLVAKESQQIKKVSF